MPTLPIGKLTLAQPVFPEEHLQTNMGKAKHLISSSKALSTAVKHASDSAHKANFKVNKGDASSALKVYNAVVSDGRYIKEFSSDPSGTAKKLHLELSASAAAAVKEAVGFGVSTGGGPSSDVVDVICVAIIVLVLADVGDVANVENIMVDQSGRITY